MVAESVCPLHNQKLLVYDLKDVSSNPTASTCRVIEKLLLFLHAPAKNVGLGLDNG